MQLIGLFDRNSVTNSPKTYQCRRTIRPLCRIIVCLVQTHIEAGEQVGKTEIHLRSYASACPFTEGNEPLLQLPSILSEPTLWDEPFWLRKDIRVVVDGSDRLRYGRLFERNDRRRIHLQQELCGG
ncbi:hypothetical protein CFRS1_v004499 [Colletotrichum fructicola]|nr:hypothetical protein CFRS1_v004499 [Colletotrichum fructicola]